MAQHPMSRSGYLCTIPVDDAADEDVSCFRTRVSPFSQPYLKLLTNNMKIVIAEGLVSLECSLSSKLDTFVTLSNESGTRLAKARTIHETLSPQCKFTILLFMPALHLVAVGNIYL